MYIKINDVKREKRIDLSYPIKNFGFAEIAVVSLFSNNVQYQVLKLHSVMDPISDRKIWFQIELMQVENYSPC